MQTDLARSVSRAVMRRNMVRPGDCVGVGVSGGADSVALLRLLYELQPGLGIRLVTLHFNHQLRGAESDADEEFVAALAAERNIPFFAGREDVAGAAREHGWNLEDAGRRLRYAYFASVMATGRITRVAVAHTADDQAETVLARLIRGTGPAGLASIYPGVDLPVDLLAKSGRQVYADSDEPVGERLPEHSFQRAASGNLVRPLLDIRRTELREYLASLSQNWREDASNQDTQRLRARIRQQILPLIERDLQPAIVTHLGRLAEMAREDETFWSALVAERLGAIVHRPVGELEGIENTELTVRCADLLAPLPLVGGEVFGDARMAVSRRLVRGLAELIRGDCRELSSQHVEQVLRLAASGVSGQRTELPGVVVERSFEWLCFFSAPTSGARRASEYPYSHTLTLGSLGEATEVVIPEIRRRFRLKVIDWPCLQGETNVDSYTLDRDLLCSPLVLRNWRAGDSFRPQGRRSVHKLKHFLRAGRIGIRDRAGWPVLTSNGKLVWARGLPVAAEFAAREKTRAGVLIAEEEI
jgi:tRNA(Ile)-lysidine synthase